MKLTSIIFSCIIFFGCVTSKVTEKQLEIQKQIYDLETERIINAGGGTIINKYLANITHKDENKEGYIEMLAWKSGQAADDYYSASGELDTLDSKYLTWVTKKAEFLERAKPLKIQRFKGARLALRLEQILGLPPKGDTTRKFMELWVKKEDLFRPCRDPEISDFECDLENPEGAFSSIKNNYESVYQSIVTSTKGFPWTRLGYTYDWKIQSKNHFGLSEYVIRQNSVVFIKNKDKTDTWIRANINNN